MKVADDVTGQSATIDGAIVADLRIRCDRDSVRYLLSKGTCTTVQVQFSQLSCALSTRHRAASRGSSQSMVLLSHHIDMVNADQFRKGVRLIAVDRGAAWRLPGLEAPPSRVALSGTIPRAEPSRSLAVISP